MLRVLFIREIHFWKSDVGHRDGLVSLNFDDNYLSIIQWWNLFDKAFKCGKEHSFLFPHSVEKI